MGLMMKRALGATGGREKSFVFFQTSCCAYKRGARFRGKDGMRSTCEICSLLGCSEWDDYLLLR